MKFSVISVRFISDSQHDVPTSLMKETFVSARVAFACVGSSCIMS